MSDRTIRPRKCGLRGRIALFYVLHCKSAHFPEQNGVWGLGPSGSFEGGALIFNPSETPLWLGAGRGFGGDNPGGQGESAASG